MCGIAGAIRWKGGCDVRLAAERMAARLSHRGPNGTAVLARGAVALAHCRLAIIDLEHGRQPMGNETGSVQLTANCEIYNYRELRRGLEERGHRFATASDAEVLVHGYEEWGAELPNRLRGMFAFAIADFERERVVLARDHLGIKPLLWHHGDGVFAFASELLALREMLGATPTGSFEAVELYLRYRYVPAPLTIYRDVFKLPPASWLDLSFDGTVRGPRKYWAVPFESVHDDAADDATWSARVEETVKESVAAHLIADVPYGVLLSGGVDSTVVSCLARRAAGRRLPAFSIDFHHPAYTEVEYARAVATRCDLEIHVATVRADAAALLPTLARHFGEPFGDPSALPTWCLARLARDHVPMVLSGDGGDEAFGGYDTYAGFLAGDSAHAVARAILRTPAQGFPQAASFIWQRLAGRPSKRGWEREVVFYRPDERRSLWRDGYESLVELRDAAFEEAAEAALGSDGLAFAQVMDFHTYLPGNIFVKVDVASMAHGLEVRTPLADREVVALAARLPFSQRWRTGTPWGTVQKYVLRRLLDRDFPPSFVYRPKKGFVGPHAIWMLHDAAMRALLTGVLLDKASPLRTLFRPNALRRELDLHGPNSDNSGRLWALLMLGLWMDANPEVRFQ